MALRNVGRRTTPTSRSRDGTEMASRMIWPVKNPGRPVLRQLAECPVPKTCRDDQDLDRNEIASPARMRKGGERGHEKAHHQDAADLGHAP